MPINIFYLENINPENPCRLLWPIQLQSCHDIIWSGQGLPKALAPPRAPHRPAAKTLIYQDDRVVPNIPATHHTAIQSLRPSTARLAKNMRLSTPHLSSGRRTMSILDHPPRPMLPQLHQRENQTPSRARAYYPLPDISATSPMPLLALPRILQTCSLRQEGS